MVCKKSRGASQPLAAPSLAWTAAKEGLESMVKGHFGPTALLLWHIMISNTFADARYICFPGGVMFWPHGSLEVKAWLE